MRRGVSLFHQKIHDQLALFLVQKLGPDPNFLAGEEMAPFQTGHQSVGRLGKLAFQEPAGFLMHECAKTLSSKEILLAQPEENCCRISELHPLQIPVVFPSERRNGRRHKIDGPIDGLYKVHTQKGDIHVGNRIHESSNNDPRLLVQLVRKALERKDRIAVSPEKTGDPVGKKVPLH